LKRPPDFKMKDKENILKRPSNIKLKELSLFQKNTCL